MGQLAKRLHGNVHTHARPGGHFKHIYTNHNSPHSRSTSKQNILSHSYKTQSAGGVDSGRAVTRIPCLNRVKTSARGRLARNEAACSCDTRGRMDARQVPLRASSCTRARRRAAAARLYKPSPRHHTNHAPTRDPPAASDPTGSISVVGSVAGGRCPWSVLQVVLKQERHALGAV